MPTVLSSDLSDYKFAWFRSPISNGALKGKDLPTEIRILGRGDNPNTKLPKLLVGEVTEKVLPQNQIQFGHARVPICYDHCLDEDAPEYVKGQPKAIFGYGDVQLDPDGIKLNNVTWTPLGEREARNYEDISPTVAVDPKGNVVFVRSVSLTPAGSVHGLHFFSAAVKLGAALNNDEDITKQTMIDQISVAELAATFGLATGAGKVEVLGHLKEMHATTVRLSTEVKNIQQSQGNNLQIIRLTAEAGKTIEMPAAELVTRLTALEGKLATFTSAGETVERNKVISLFASDGKVPLGEDGKAMGVEALSALSLPELRRLHANTPSTVPLSARGRKPNESVGGGDLKGSARAATEWAHLEK